MQDMSVPDVMGPGHGDGRQSTVRATMKKKKKMLAAGKPSQKERTSSRCCVRLNDSRKAE